MTTSHTTRERVLEVASTRFRRLGFRHTSVEAITSAAGIAKGSLYLHYPSKQDLYLAAVERAVEDFLATATERMPATEPAPVRLRGLVLAAIESYGADDLLGAPMVDNGELLTPTAAKLARELQRARVMALISETITDGQAEGTIRAELDPDATAKVLFEIGWRVVRGHLQNELSLPLADALTTLNAIVGLGIQVRTSDE